MKKITIVCATIVALSAASVQATYNLTAELGSPREGSGGEFKITAKGSGTTSWSTIGIADGEMFDSFCLETNEFFSPSSSTILYAQLNTGAVGGGVNAGPEGVGFDQISKGTAWLFREHWDQDGTIGTVSYDTSPAGSSDAGDMQNAIWWLEDEITIAAPLGNKYIAEAVSQGIAGSAVGLKIDATPYEYDVGVLNIWSVDPDASGFIATSHHRQDMLVVVPEPSVLVGTLASCIFGFIAFRRRQNRKS